MPPARSGQGRPDRCDDPDCEHGGLTPAHGCRACGRAGPQAGPQAGPRHERTGAGNRARLRFPWGEEIVPDDGRLPIGREGSPLAPRLAAYTNVSRRHAEITIASGRLAVVDLESVNGTFVNDERIPSLRPRTLRDGDEVRFAAGLRAKVVLAEGT